MDRRATLKYIIRHKGSCESIACMHCVLTPDCEQWVFEYKLKLNKDFTHKGWSEWRSAKLDKVTELFLREFGTDSELFEEML